LSLFDALVKVEKQPFVIASEAKPFGPELTAEGQSRYWTDIKEIATLARRSASARRHGASRLAMTVSAFL